MRGVTFQKDKDLFIATSLDIREFGIGHTEEEALQELKDDIDYLLSRDISDFSEEFLEYIERLRTWKDERW